MKIVCISDTHGKHHRMMLPPGDMIIHAGDFSNRGKKEEVQDFLAWFSSLPYPYKIFIGGNHDFFLEERSEQFNAMVPDNCLYLNDSSVEVEGIRIWGSPVTPYFFNMAFNRQRGEEIRKHWELIPAGTDIVVTHGPPMGILDRTIYGLEVGCQDLKECLSSIKPKLNVFGHIHEEYGISKKQETTFINASCLDVHYKLANPPIIVEWVTQPIVISH